MVVAGLAWRMASPMRSASAGTEPPLPTAALAANFDAGQPLHLGVRFKSGYGIGQVVESISTVTLNTYLFFYLTNVCGLSGSLTGVALFIALAIDAVADPLLGSFSDNLRTRWGRRVPVMTVSLVPLALALGGLFSIPSLSGWTLFLYVFALIVALRVSMSGFIVPYLALGAELSPDYDDRSSIVAFRVIFGIASMLIPLVLGFGTFLRGHDGLLDRAGYARFGWVSGVLLLAAGMLASVVSLKAPPRHSSATASREHVSRRLFGEVREVFRNPSFRRLFGGVLLFFVGQGLTGALGLDANKYFWSLDVKQIQTVAISLVGGLALGLPVGFALIGRIEKRTTVLAGIAIFAIAQGAPALGQVLGLLPPDIGVRMSILVGAGVIAGIAATLVTIAFQSALADAVDEHEQLFGARREGLYFASLSFANKAATGIGSLLAGFLLDSIQFPSKAIANGHTVAIAAGVLRHLGLVYGPAAALLTLASLAFFSRYRLNRAMHGAIAAALATRRPTAPSGAGTANSRSREVS